MDGVIIGMGPSSTSAPDDDSEPGTPFGTEPVSLFRSAELTVELEHFLRWPTGFMFTVHLYPDAPDRFSGSGLTAALTSYEDSDPTKALDVEVIYTRKGVVEAGVRRVPCAMAWAGGGGPKGWEIGLWTSPLPESADVVSIRVTLPAASMDESVSLDGAIFHD